MDPTIRGRLTDTYLTSVRSPDAPAPTDLTSVTPRPARLVIPVALAVAIFIWMVWLNTRATPPVASQALSDWMVADFNAPEEGPLRFGAWEHDPHDPTQFCSTTLDPDARSGQGSVLRIEYDVESPHIAFNGVWFALGQRDLAPYQALRLSVQGDPEAGWTERVKLELKTASSVGTTYLTGITDRWQTVRIPLSQFRGLRERQAATELVLVFEDRLASRKTGVLYLDDVEFTRE